MSQIHLWPAAGLFLFLLGGTAASSDEPSNDPAVLHDRVIHADSPDKASEAYKAYFTRLGLSALVERQKDEDTGIALQAAWEVHKKPAKRAKAIDGRSDDIYDPGELAKFLAFLKDRTKAPVPDWWAESIVHVDQSPGEGHSFSDYLGDGWPKLRKAKTGAFVPEGAELEAKDDMLVYTAGGRSVQFPKDVFDKLLTDSYAGVVGEKRAVVAVYSSLGASEYQLAGFEAKGGKPVWTADVWAADWGGGTGFPFLSHRMELRTRGDALFVFGAESYGMYMEAFDAATGKCQYRFSSCYWSNFPEKWGLK